jgi:hypothetical protein
MDFNYTAIIVASFLQFVVGAIWYSALFGNLWGKIHGFDKFSKEEQQKMMKGMAPFYAIQFFVTLVTTCVLALMTAGLPLEWNRFGIAGFFWLGFVVPTQVSAVIFGGTEGKWIVKKIAVMAGASLACLLVAAGVLQYFS